MRAGACAGFIAAFAAACALPSAGAFAQDAYAVGVTAAMTGPAAATQAPVIEMLRIYVDRLNAKGGINGHQVNLLIEDDQAEPSKAAANATKLIRQENVMLMINSSLSSTYGPVIAEAKRAERAAVVRRRGVPEGGASAEAGSAAVLLDRIRFLASTFRWRSARSRTWRRAGEARLWSASRCRSRASASITREKHADDARHEDGGQGIHPARPPPTTRRSPPRSKAPAPNWGYAYAPWPAEAKTFEALRRLGWTGDYLAYGHIQAEDELKRIADPRPRSASPPMRMFQDDLPVQKEIRDVAAAGKYSYPGNLRDRRLDHRTRA